MTIPIILASTSRYRASLLQKLRVPFDVAAPNIDETPHRHESPRDSALRFAREKAMKIAEEHEDGLIIGSDQVAEINGHLLGKPGSRKCAIDQLRASSGRCVRFYTAVCLVDARSLKTLSDIDITKVYFRKLSDDQIDRYVDIDEPFDCAGGFKSEGLGITLFDKLETDDPNALVGLPLIKLTRLLERFGYPIL